MPGLIPENILDDILSRVDIVELISSYIPLKRTGKNFKACCPFHHEKTPSFIVSSDRQLYNCFGCGESGNAFKFLMRYEHMDFPEAVEVLARKAGVVLPQKNSPNNERQGLITQLYKVNELVAQFYSVNLDSQQGLEAKNYLLKRGVSLKVIKELRLGFALDSWDSLINYLRSKGLNLALIEKAGLLVSKEGGGYYDRFRNRIVFPIFDIKGRILGFGCRVLDESLPKYINSPETSIYTKGRNLYGFNFAKDAIREKDFVIVVEGYMDFILPFQYGLKNITASLGTALSIEQVRLLKRYTNNVVMIYDSDSAGELATLRSMDVFIEEELNLKVVSLPKGYDPASFIGKAGIESFSKEVKNASDIIDYKLNILTSRFDIKEAVNKAKICGLMLETINKIKNAILRDEYLRKLSLKLDVKEESLLSESLKINKPKPLSNNRASAFKKITLKASPTEKLLMALVLEENSLITRIKDHLSPQDLSDERLSRILSVMFQLVESGREVKPQILMNHLEEDDSSLICHSDFLPEGLTLEHKERMADDCLKRIKKEKIKIKRKMLHEEIKEAQNVGDEQRLNALMQEFHLLIKKEVGKI